MNHLWFPPSWGSCHGSTLSNWSMQLVFNIIIHDIVSFREILLLGGFFIQLPRPFLENLAFISDKGFPHKILPLSPTKVLCFFFVDGYLSPAHPMDIYLQFIQAYLESHLQALSWKIYPIPFLNGIWRESHLLVSHFSKWSIY